MAKTKTQKVNAFTPKAKRKGKAKKNKNKHESKKLYNRQGR